MRFTEGESGGYLRGVLVDGAKPFLYRGGVRELLGLPGDGGDVLYAPPAPPAGFQYVSRGARPPGDGPDASHEVVREFPDRINRRAPDDWSREAEPRRGAATPSPNAAGPSAARTASEPASHGHRSASVPLPGTQAAPASPAPVRPATPGDSSTSFAVPGVSRAVRDFPALRETVDPKELETPRDERKASAADQEKNRSSEPPAMPERAASVPPAMPQQMPRREAETMRRDDVREMEAIASIERVRERSDDDRAMPAAPRPAPTVSAQTRAIVPAARTTRGQAPSEDPRETGPEAARFASPADPTAGALAIKGALSVTKGRGSLEGAVEQIVARRVAEERERWEEESARTAAGSAARRVEIVRAPAVPAKDRATPAFWERSYLHRFRIRNFR